MIVLRQKEYSNKLNKAAKKAWEVGPQARKVVKDYYNLTEEELSKRGDKWIRNRFRNLNSPVKLSNDILEKSDLSIAEKIMINDTHALDAKHAAGRGATSKYGLRTPMVGGGFFGADSSIPEKFRRRGLAVWK